MYNIDSFLQSLNNTAPQVKDLLRKIKQKDYETEQLQTEIHRQREMFLKHVHHSNHKKDNNLKEKSEIDLKKIVSNDKRLLQLSKQKVLLAEKLYNCIHEPTQNLDKQLNTKVYKIGKYEQDNRRIKKGKRKGRPSKQEWQNDPNQPKYCYCGKPSYGEMVMCENTYCTRQWFHRQCIDQKRLPDKWYCRDCRHK